jgi:diguanylate cyclase (GGDEF)-like protein/PAS domain S-box-containing protein
MPLAEAPDVSRRKPSGKTKTKPKSRKSKRFRNLSDPLTLSELASRLREGIYITTLDGEIIDANPAFLEMFGVESLDELKGYSTSDFVRPEVRAREMAALEREGSVRDVEFQLTRRDGHTRTVVDSAFLSIDPETGEKYCHGILVDITHRKELQTQLLELSIRDPLTGCYNRRYLNTVTRQCEAQPKGEWGCIYLDIDHFKQYNDRNGHAEGDAILVKMARFLMRHVRAEEAVVRVGGDEFLVVLCDSDHEQTENVVERLRAAAPTSAPVPFSMGWAARRGSETFEGTMIRADHQLLAVRVDDRRDLQKRRKRKRRS